MDLEFTEEPQGRRFSSTRTLSYPKHSTTVELKQDVGGLFLQKLKFASYGASYLGIDERNKIPSNRAQPG